MAADVTGKSDPYVEVFVLGPAERQVHKTRSVKFTLNPKWNEDCSFHVTMDDAHELRLDLYDWDLLSSPDPLGSVMVPVNFDAQEVDGWHDVGPNAECPEPSGKIHIAMSFTRGAKADPA